ncbi:MAG: universal stress protein, partial [Bergeyella zoohelcum]|nr:universal stress protein [Bergeyella zoohelcum]
MKNILLPVDFSDSTDILLSGAIKFAKEINGKITLIHISPSDIGFAIGDTGFQYIPEVEQNEMKEEEKLLIDLQEKVVAQGVKSEYILKLGIAKDI